MRRDRLGIPDCDDLGNIIAYNGDRDLRLHEYHPARRIIRMAWHATRVGVRDTYVATAALVDFAAFLRHRDQH